MKQACVYILSNKYRGTLYVGVTSNLPQRIWQHKSKVADGFTKKHDIDRLVYYELLDDMYNAISREKQLKAGNRVRKIILIEAMNPTWDDLYPNIIG
jgi:putative endonuclease